MLEPHRPTKQQRKRRMASQLPNIIWTYPSVKKQHKYSSIEDMLELANRQRLPVKGDGNCGYYSIIASCDGRSALDHTSVRARSLNPSMRDYEKQTKLRRDCVGWLLKNENLPFCLMDRDRDVVKHQLEDGQWKPVEPLQRDDSAIRRHLQGKTSSQGQMGEYCRTPLIRAAAACKECFIIVINTLELGDTCAVYPPGVSTTSVLALSWAEELVPKLLRQDAGETDLPFYYVMLHNGRDDASGHFDGTTTTC